MQNSEDALNIWQYKPWWCQPWSILLTGIAIIVASWLFLHRFWITSLVAVPICVWMGYFLLVYPKLMQQFLAEPIDPVTKANLDEI